MKTEQQLREYKSPHKELKVKVKVKERRCMTCGDNFESEGFHNRMCNYCRRYSGGDFFTLHLKETAT